MTGFRVVRLPSAKLRHPGGALVVFGGHQGLLIIFFLNFLLESQYNSR